MLTSCAEVRSLIDRKDNTKSGDILFEDDFNQAPNGWGLVDRAGGNIESAYGGMLFTVNLPDFMFWSVNGGIYDDTQIEVDAILLDGPVNDNFGVICRYQDEKNFYGFLVSHDGYYGIIKYIDGSMVTATEKGNLAYSEVIRKGGVVNHIKAVCQRDTLSLSVNDTLLASVVDDSFQEGKIGLIAGAYDDPGVMVFFDNLKVYQP